MPEVTIVYWRDIPAQVIVGRGRKAAKHALPERFEQGIDRAAMLAGLGGSEDYLSQWRKGEPVNEDGDAAVLAEAKAAAIDAEYPRDRMRVLVNNRGVEPDPS